jgi:hypothetical protein
MKPAAYFIIHFLSRVRSRLGHIGWTSRHAHDGGFAVTQFDNNAAHILHNSVIRMRSRLQSL